MVSRIDSESLKRKHEDRLGEDELRHKKKRKRHAKRREGEPKKHDEHSNGAQGSQAKSTFSPAAQDSLPANTASVNGALAEQQLGEKSSRKHKRQRRKEARRGSVSQQESGTSSHINGSPVNGNRTETDRDADASSHPPVLAIQPTGTSGQEARRKRKSNKRRKQGIEGSRDKTRSRSKSSALRNTGARDVQWNISDPTGGRCIDSPPMFSSDEKHVLFATQNAACVFATDTSLLEHTLSSDSKGEVTSYTLSPTESRNFYTATSGGLITQWNWTDGKRLGRWMINSPISGLAAAKMEAQNQDTIFTIDKAKNWMITAHRFRSARETQDTELSTLLKHSQPVLSMKVVSSGSVIIAITTNSLLVGKLLVDKPGPLSNLEYSWREFSCKEPPTCFDVKVHDDGVVDVVYGGLKGCLYAYHNVLVNMGIEPPATKVPSRASSGDARQMRWHREAVGAVAFSKDGNYIISGGQETVLVLWQLDTGKRQYLPHLESPIRSLRVSPSGSSYVVGLSDNSIMVLSTSSLRPTANYAGLQSPSISNIPSQKFLLPTKELINHATTGIASYIVASVVNPKVPNHLLAAVPAYQSSNDIFAHSNPAPYLQTYDIASGRHVSRQELTRTNATEVNTGPGGNKILEPNVKHVQISRNGAWLATVEEWIPPRQDVEDLAADELDAHEELAKYREVTLRFWSWSENDKVWSLNSRLDAPHPVEESRSSGRVLSLAAHPSKSSFATFGEDSMLRIWTPKRRRSDGRVIRGDDSHTGASQAEGKRSGTKFPTWWTVDSAISLEARASEETLQRIRPHQASVAYSNDGSTLAVNQQFRTFNKALLVSDAHEPLHLEVSPGSDLVHFIDADASVLRESRSHLYTSALSTDSPLYKDDTIQALAFLGRYLIVAGRSAVCRWDLISFDLVTSLPLPALDLLQTPITPVPPPQLAVNLATSTFAIAAPVTMPATSTQPMQKGLPPHAYRDLTSRLLVFSVVSQERHRDDPIFAKTLPRLVLRLSSAAGDADGDGPSDGETESELAMSALKKGYVLLDAGASVRTVRPTKGSLFATDVNGHALAGSNDSEESEQEFLTGAGLEHDNAHVGGETGPTDEAASFEASELLSSLPREEPRVVPSEKLTELLDTAPGRSALPSVREMFEGVLDLFVRRK